MPYPPLSMLDRGLPDHCAPISPYLTRLSSAFYTCVPTHLALLSTSLGFLSIVAWLFAQIPQIYKNYRLKSASGLSIYFLCEWLLGDLTNLVGGLLTGQAAWQVTIAAYYVFVDVCLTSQYLWYTRIVNGKRKKLIIYDVNGDHSDGASGETLEGISPPAGNGHPTEFDQKTTNTKESKPEKASATMNKHNNETQAKDHALPMNEKTSLLRSFLQPNPTL